MIKEIKTEYKCPCRAKRVYRNVDHLLNGEKIILKPHTACKKCSEEYDFYELNNQIYYLKGDSFINKTTKLLIERTKENFVLILEQDYTLDELKKALNDLMTNKYEEKEIKEIIILRKNLFNEASKLALIEEIKKAINGYKTSLAFTKEELIEIDDRNKKVDEFNFKYFIKNKKAKILNK